MSKKRQVQIAVDSHEAYINRELSWLQFARRVLAQVEDQRLPLLERVKFAGIMGMLHDELFMKRVSGLKRQIQKGVQKVSIDGRTPLEELMACREEVLGQTSVLGRVIGGELIPALGKAGIPIIDYDKLTDKQRAHCAEYFQHTVQPVLTPLAVDDEHPFPFISSLCLNILVALRDTKKARKRLVRIKVPDNLPRWVELSGGGYVTLEQVIASNLTQFFGSVKSLTTYLFRVTRGVEGSQALDRELQDPDMPEDPGALIRYVSGSLQARRFAGVVRLQVGEDMPDKIRDWLTLQLGIGTDDVYPVAHFMGVNDMLRFRPEGHPELCDPPHVPVTHPQLAGLADAPQEMFSRIKDGDILLHHPYHNFDTSIVTFLRAASQDPSVLGIKLTIYRTSSDSPIILALIEAARRGKQVAVLVEINARFDEAPNIAWGELLEKEGVHVSYGVEQLKTHVKLVLVIRQEPDAVRRYVHVGTGNYHAGTARIYEDLGMFTCDKDLGADVAAVFNELTGAVAPHKYSKLLVAPDTMRDRFVELIHREVEHAKAGRPAGIRAKMNQLQDPDMIRELYLAGQAGVPITLNVRGLCCLRPGMPRLSENIRVFGVVGRFLEHSRIYCFINGGEPEYFIGSADWMRRNLSRRVETITPVEAPALKAQLETILDVYDKDNCSVWDGQPDGSYVLRQPAKGEECRAAQVMFAQMAQAEPQQTASPAESPD